MNSIGTAGAASTWPPTSPSSIWSGGLVLASQITLNAWLGCSPFSAPARHASSNTVVMLRTKDSHSSGPLVSNTRGSATRRMARTKKVDQPAMRDKPAARALAQYPPAPDQQPSVRRARQQIDSAFVDERLFAGVELRRKVESLLERPIGWREVGAEPDILA